MTLGKEGVAGACATHKASGVLAGRYRLERLLGCGGMGEVYLAHDEHLGRPVAVKLLPEEVSSDPNRLARFRREGLLAAGLSHPNICTVFEVGEAGRRPFIVMEYVEGETLHHRVANGPLPVAEVVELGLQIADALAEAHSRGLVHRDIKSGNIVVTTKRQVKILDFGLAKRVGVEPVKEATLDTESASTQPGGVVGTLPYMSPEQALGLEVDHRSDLFSFGVVLYELVTGRLPFQGRSGPELIDRILHSDPSSISRFVEEVPDEAVRIIRKLLAKDPEDRYQAAVEVVVDLRLLRSDLRGEGRAAEVVPLGRARRARRLVLQLALSVVAAALISLIVVQALRGNSVAQIRLEPVTHTTAPGWEANPALSPDGHEVIYCAETDGNVDLWLMDSAGGQPLRLTDHLGVDCSPAWLANGREILFVSDRGGTASLWRVGRFGGSAAPVLEDAVEPAVSPDGSRIAFSRRGRAGTGLTIWVAPLDDPGAARQLTPDGLGVWDHENPSFSPDGRSIAYADFQDVWLVAADGSEPPRRLTDGAATHRDPVWFPDGRTLLLTSWREGTLALWAVGTDGHGLSRVTTGTGPECQPSLSGDGIMVAYSTHRVGQNVVVTDLVTGHREWLASSSHDASPDLRPDGGAVVFSSDRTGGIHLWLQPLVDGRPEGQPRQLTSGQGRSAVPAFSLDGEVIAYYRIVDQRRELWVVPAHGGSAVQLTEGTPNDINPSFSPDGRCLAFARVRNGVSEIWALELASGGAASPPSPMIIGHAGGSFPAWSPAGDRLAFLADGDAWIVEANACPAPEFEAQVAARVTQGAEARDLAWVADGGALLVSGTWGGDRLELRRVPLDEPAGGTELVMEIGDPRGEGTFGVSRDERFMTTIDTDARGDIWVARVVESQR